MLNTFIPSSSNETVVELAHTSFKLKYLVFWSINKTRIIMFSFLKMHMIIFEQLLALQLLILKGNHLGVSLSIRVSEAHQL